MAELVEFEQPSHTALEQSRWDDNPEVWWPGSFGMDAEGLYQTSGGEKPKTLRVAQPFRVLCLTRSAEGAGWGKLIAWKDPDGQSVEHVIFNRDLLDPREACKPLIDKGLQVYEPLWLVKALQTVLCDRRERLLRQVGWTSGAYALGDLVIGETGGERCRFVGELPARIRRGLVDDWTRHVAAPAIGNSRLVLAISLAFVPPLLRPLGKDGFGLNLYGPSSIGKTTALKAGVSVWGCSIGNWRATANGLEGVCAAANDGLLALDELSQADPQALGEAAYMLANGSGKARARRDGSARERLEHCLAFISTGEVRLGDKLKEDGRQRVHRAGQSVRLIDVAADAGVGLGLFENLGGHKTSNVFAVHLSEACRDNQGTAIEVFLQRLVELRPEDWAELAKRVQALHAALVRSSDCGEVQRVADKFALIGIAGELAGEFGLTSWPQGDAAATAAKIFEGWCEARGGRGAAEDQEILAKLEAYIHAHGGDRFREEAPHRAGFIHNVRGRECFCIFPPIDVTP